MQSQPARRRAVLPVLAAALALGACDIPTSPPQIETAWRIPVDAATLPVSDLLPSNVTISSDGSAFVLALDPTTISRTLGELCPPCASAHGFTVPKPAFTVTIDDEVELPAEVASATVSGGNLNVTLTHDFGFDPIRPSSTARGSIVVTLRNGGRTIGSTTQSGTATDLPSGIVRNLVVPIEPGALSGPLDVEVTINSPAGDPVTINANSSFSITISATDLRLSEANVAVQAQQVSVDEVTLDAEIDESILDLVLGGQLFLTIVNPFAVSGTLTLQVTGGSAAVQPKAIQIQPSTTSTAVVTFSQQELRSMLGSPVRLTISGPVSATAGTITVRPGQVVEVRSSMQIEVGPTED